MIEARYAAGKTYEVTGKGFDPEVGQVICEDGKDGRNLRSHQFHKCSCSIWVADVSVCQYMASPLSDTSSSGTRLRT